MNRVHSVLVSGALVFAGGLSHAQTPTLVRADQLRADLTAFSHDSMAGRLAGSDGAFRAANTIISRFTAAALLPGLKSTFAQDVPIVQVRLDTAGAGFADGRVDLTYSIDFLPLPGIHGLMFPRSANVTSGPANNVMFGGRLGTATAIPPGKVRGKVVVLLPPLRANGQPEYQVWGMRNLLQPYRIAGAVAIVGLELMPASIRHLMSIPQLELKQETSVDTMFPPLVMVSRAGASLILGKNADAAELTRDTTLAAAGSLKFRVTSDAPPRPSRNIVGIIEGSDPTLKAQYVVLSARYDGFGVETSNADAKSVWPATDDVIMNGADEVSGAVALLSIAENLVKSAARPKRSIMFVLTIGAESRQAGAQWFVEHLPVPRESIVANIDVGTIGRGGAGDIAGGGPAYLQVAGSRRLSTQFGDWIDEVNKSSGAGFGIDYSFDAPSQPARYNCTGGHWNFARLGIPAVFITTGAHAESRTVNDAVDKVDFSKLSAVTEFISALATDVANRPARPAIDKPKPDSRAACTQ